MPILGDRIFSGGRCGSPLVFPVADLAPDPTVSHKTLLILNNLWKIKTIGSHTLATLN
ncbi:MAG: hypothetical protein P5702_18830 [Limnospira sp. PMC 1291.21]|uniref:Uncharacterized protein n=2 Tax=Limnospira TaxID=2596745 RepID=B5WA89_LIMMA|nr:MULTISPECIES: hypothetical protein [Limnospira]EKD06649.1 hypothetical protein SPLC1_S532430 [Arthrospira platensis C1]MDC0839295.1 hypothetical protein [Limnoraphis robusta]MDY7055390.1 hypothetical protein [Limnospira fusiformis LS22]QJB26559.1 hypothetical protein HFV01_13030 [Limnospira fusiformis SAG 85.79]EDZ91557.1 hypothetical protein AmaxDRAFT_5689 [Limnospira maxima CS-328]